MTECPQPSGLSNPKHPIWPIIRMGVAVIAINVTVLTVVLLFRANKFDGDELKNIGTFASIITGIGGMLLGAYKGFVHHKGSSGDGTDV